MVEGRPRCELHGILIMDSYTTGVSVQATTSWWIHAVQQHVRESVASLRKFGPKTQVAGAEETSEVGTKRHDNLQYG